MAKHGAEMHFVRPDGVYRTSVLQAIPGYQPVSNAYEVSTRFTAAPYFATTLAGPSPFWEKVKMRWAMMKAQWQANRVPGMTMQVAAMAQPTVQAAPQSPITAGLLPNVGPSSPESVKYGIGPANEMMANVGMRITAGLVQTGDDALPPQVAVPQLTAAQTIAPEAAMNVRQLARMVQNGVPGFVGQSAYQAAMERWNKQRSFWWYQNS